MQIPHFIDNGDPRTYEALDHYLRTEPRADAKAYAFDGVGIVGSSNFTAPGLTPNSGPNSVLKPDRFPCYTDPV